MILVGMVGPPGGVKIYLPTSGSPDAFPSPFIPAAGAPQGGTADTLAFLPADALGAGLEVNVPDPVTGQSSATVLVLPGDQMVLGVKLANDHQPRWLLCSDSADGLYLGDGAVNPLTGGANVYYRAGQLGLYGPDGVAVASALGAAAVHVYAGADTPNGAVTAARPGDVCIVAGPGRNPGLFQSTAAGASNWRTVGGGSRQTVTFTTTVTATGAQQQATVTLAKSYRLVRVTADVACRVRLYTTAANQALDANRTTSEDPGEGSGVILDYDMVTSPAVFLGGDLSPEVLGASMETAPSANIPVTVDLAGTGPAHVTFTYFSLE